MESRNILELLPAFTSNTQQNKDASNFLKGASFWSLFSKNMRLLCFTLRVFRSVRARDFSFRIRFSILKLTIGKH